MVLPKTKEEFKEIPKSWETSGTNLVYFGDFHYRKVSPSTRLDDFEATELQKAESIKKIALKYHAKALLQPGDFLDKPKLDDIFLNKIMSIWGFPQMIEARKDYDSGVITKEEFTKRTLDYVPLIGLIGNHELYGGSLKTYDKTSLSFLEKSKFMHIVDRDNPYIIKGNNDETIAITGESYDLNLLKKKDTDLSRFRLDDKKADVDIFMVHEALYDTALGEGMNWMPVSKIWDKTKADVTIAGHIHVGFGWLEHENKLFGNPGAPAQQSNSEQELTKVVTATVIHINDDKTVQVMDIPLEGLQPSNMIFDTTKKEREVEIQDQMKDIAEIIDNVDSDNGTNVNDIIDKIAKDEDIDPSARELAIEKTSIAMNEMGANEPLEKDVDYSLKKIILKNFESHLYTEIDLTQDKTPTVLIGESSQGKSSLLRGIYWVLENQGDSKRFVRRHAGVTTTSVEIIRADGLSVKREVEIKLTKTKNLKIVRNGYTITQPDGTVSETNTEGLHEIQKLFGMNYLKLDSKDEIPLNFMKQEDGWYFIGLKAPQRAKVIGALYGTQFILSAIKKLETDRRSFEADRKITLKDIDEITSELEPLKNIDDSIKKSKELSKEFDVLEKNTKVLDESLDAFKKLKIHRSSFVKAEKEYNLLNKSLTSLQNAYLKISEKTTLIKESISLNNQLKEANETIANETKVLSYKENIKKLVDKNKAFEITKNNLVEMIKLQKALSNSIQEQNKMQVLLDNKIKITALKTKIAEVEQNKKLINEMDKISSNRNILIKEYVQHKKEVTTYQKELKELTDELKELNKQAYTIKEMGSTNVTFYGVNKLVELIKQQTGGKMAEKSNNLVNRIEALNDKMNDSKTAMEVSKAQGKQASDRLKELGIDPEKADEQIKELQQKTRTEYEDIETQLTELEDAVNL